MAAAPAGEGTPPAEPRAPVVPAPPELLAELPAEVGLFADFIVPMLREKCGDCHLEEPLMGDLSVASFDDLMRGGVVLELPAGETIRDVAAVYRAVMGGWRTVNGYSGYEPAGYQQLREASADGTVVFEPWLTGGTLHVLVSEDATALNRLVANERGSQRIAQFGGLVQYRIDRTLAP